MNQINYSLTNRGFIVGKFVDINDRPCSIQQSSLATECALWLGEGENRMHLDETLVDELIFALTHWRKNDELPWPPAENKEAEQTAANSESVK